VKRRGSRDPLDLEAGLAGIQIGLGGAAHLGVRRPALRKRDRSGTAAGQTLKKSPAARERSVAVFWPGDSPTIWNRSD